MTILAWYVAGCFISAGFLGLAWTVSKNATEIKALAYLAIAGIALAWPFLLLVVAAMLPVPLLRKMPEEWK